MIRLQYSFLMKRAREEPCHLCGHYHDYEGGERCATCGHVLQIVQAISEERSGTPTEILPGFLYLGAYEHTSCLELLRAMDITHILSLVPSCTELFKHSFTYCTVRTTPVDFEECFQYIERVRIEQKRVLVHCMTGITKSPAVIIAYLVRLRGWSLAESQSWVQDRHSKCRLSQGDADRLSALFGQQEERTERGKTATTVPFSGWQNNRTNATNDRTQILSQTNPDTASQ